MHAMPNAFDFSVSPFHSLTPTEQTLVRASVDIAYFQAQEVIIETGSAPSALYFIIKGQVAQMEGSNTVHIYGPQDSFDGRALMAGRSSHRFVAREEVLADILDQHTVQTLIASNATFSALLFAGLSEKLQAISQQSVLHEMQSLTLARVDSAVLHAPHYVQATASVAEVARLFHTECISQRNRNGIRLFTSRRRGTPDAILAGTLTGMLRKDREVVSFPEKGREVSGQRVYKSLPLGAILVRFQHAQVTTKIIQPKGA